MAAVRAGGRAPVAGGEVLVVAGGSRRRTCASPQGTRRSISSRHRHGRQEATRWRVRAGNGAPIATDARRRRRWQVRAGDGAPVAGGEVLAVARGAAAPAARARGHTARRQQPASPRTAGGDGAGGFERAMSHPSRAGSFSRPRCSTPGCTRGSPAHDGQGSMGPRQALAEATAPAVRAGMRRTRRGRAPVLWLAIGIRRQGFEHVRLFCARRANDEQTARHQHQASATNARRRRWRRFERVTPHPSRAGTPCASCRWCVEGAPGVRWAHVRRSGVRWAQLCSTLLNFAQLCSTLLKFSKILQQEHFTQVSRQPLLAGWSTEVAAGTAQRSNAVVGGQSSCSALGIPTVPAAVFSHGQWPRSRCVRCGRSGVKL